jgi:protein farnesyltransferase/geranylgeranyltransferase type-1 subunit alpha
VLGILRAAQLPKSTLKDFALEFADLDRPDEVYSSHALDLLADIYAEEGDSKHEAVKALNLLATRYDPIRASSEKVCWKNLRPQPKYDVRIAIG